MRLIEEKLHGLQLGPYLRAGLVANTINSLVAEQRLARQETMFHHQELQN
jgi:hypothetical protein